MDLLELTITQAHEGLKNKEFSSKELTQAYLEQIKKKDGEIGAYLSVTEDLAISQAENADEKIKNDEKTLLIALKQVALAKGGFQELSNKTGLSRESLYKTLSIKGIKNAAVFPVPVFAIPSTSRPSVIGRMLAS